MPGVRWSCPSCRCQNPNPAPCPACMLGPVLAVTAVRMLALHHACRLKLSLRQGARLFERLSYSQALGSMTQAMQPVPPARGVKVNPQAGKTLVGRRTATATSSPLPGLHRVHRRQQHGGRVFTLTPYTLPLPGVHRVHGRQQRGGEGERAGVALPRRGPGLWPLAGDAPGSCKCSIACAVTCKAFLGLRAWAWQAGATRPQ